MPSTLSGREQERLLDAVLSAFQEHELEQLMLHELDVTLFHHVSRGPFRAVVGELIPWLCAHGYVDRFLDAVSSAVPGRSDVQQVVAALRSVPTNPVPPVLPQHPLHAYALTGKVGIEWITDDIAEAFGEAVGLAYRDLALGRVISEVRKANPEADRAYLVSSGECPTNVVPDDQYWLATLNRARLKSPRTLAAFLLYACSTSGFGSKARADREALLTHLRSLPH